ncbi:hypothetical protein K402DRAFT_128773 [Aulographum hederae CBS 113979]|uniref:FAD-binding PCMH-type domain-containing protein n=1 Tax=Aulographum hederae CBS 113979 TaxID=1176131 RepID=A0A6G1HF86_9PEZI|nr:hypothetical protein K402DRAFT_128773 [Aulographum hederae CBS 113979]
MRTAAILLLASAFVAAHGPGGDDEAAPEAAPAAPVAAPAPAPVASSGKAAPAGCKAVLGDANWPANDLFMSAMPNVINSQVATAGRLAKRHGPGEEGADEAPAPAGVKKPTFRMNAKTVADVEAAVQFAAKNNIRLSILNSGHDFLGRNDAASGLALVTTNLNGMKISDSFIPSARGDAQVVPGAPINTMRIPATRQAYVTIGVGLGTQALNDALAPSNLFTLGAAHGPVGVAGGWAQTAGHSPLGRHFGLGADVVVEYQVVTADGKLKIANAVSNPDLFWALRGGGGGTYGVVTQATIKAFPSPKMTLTAFFMNTTKYEDTDSVYAPAAKFHNALPAAVEKGFSGYYYLYRNAIKGAFVSINENANGAYANATWQPILNNMLTYPGMSKDLLVYQTQDFPNFKAWFDEVFGAMGEMHKRDVNSPRSIARSIFADETLKRRHGPEGDAPAGDAAAETEAGGITPMASRLLDASALNNPGLARALKASMPTTPMGQLRGNVVGGGVISRGGADTSVHPAWRRALVHLISTTSTQEQPSAAALRAISPASGSYANEGARDEPNWQQAFFGANYNRLLSIKTKYDPEGVFWVTPGVGADLYAVKDGRVCSAAANGSMPLLSRSAPNTDSNKFSGGDEEADTTSFPILMGAQGPYPNPAMMPATPAAGEAPEGSMEGMGEGDMGGMDMGASGAASAPPAAATKPISGVEGTMGGTSAEGHSHGNAADSAPMAAATKPISGVEAPMGGAAAEGHAHGN